MKNSQKSDNVLRIVVLLLLCSIMGGVAEASQIMLLDTLVIMRGVQKPDEHYGKWESHENLIYAPGVPTNWKTPVNYFEGTVYWRFEIQKKQKNTSSMQVCWNKNDGGYWHMCLKCQKFTAEGVYRYSQKVQDMWYHNKQPPWQKFVGGYPQLVMKDRCKLSVTMGNPKWTSWLGYPNMDLYYPLTIRTTMFVVKKGGTFQKPDYWNKNTFRTGGADTTGTDTTGSDTTGSDTTTFIRGREVGKGLQRITIKARSEGGIALQTPQSGLEQILVYDVRGRMIHQARDIAGNTNYVLSSNSNAGVFFVRARSASMWHTFRVPVLK